MIRVHETDSDGNQTSFNLDDWAQFDRYTKCVAANRGCFMYQSFTKMMPNRVDFREIHNAAGLAFSISGELADKHGECAFCYAHFDRTAGNGLGESAFYPLS